MRFLFVLAVCATTWSAVPHAHASPWTLRQRQVAFVAGYDYQWANREFIEDREARRFPLHGRYSASPFTLNTRFGLTDDLELELTVPIKFVSYVSDPVILLPGDGSPQSFDFYQENILDFSQSQAGVGDIWITGRYALLHDPLPIAVELRLKAPTGYDRPEGTFGSDPATIADFQAQVGSVVRPDNVSDDVTLGDGQVDLNLNCLMGASCPSRTFMVIQAGYNLRLQGAGDQVLASLKVGQAIGQRLLVYAGGNFAYAVTQGDLIGVSVAAIDPSLPAAEYQGLDNLLLREVRLERAAIDIQVGGIIRVTDSVEFNVGYGRTVWGRNTAASNAVFLSLGVRIVVTAGVQEEPEPEVVEPEEEVVEEEYEYEYVEEPAEPEATEPVTGAPEALPEPA